MRLIVLSTVTLLSSCITVTPTPYDLEPRSTIYANGPIVPLQAPPHAYNYISPNVKNDIVGAERYAEDVISYTAHVRNHLKYVIDKYDLDRVDLKERCRATDAPIRLELPPLPDLTNVSDADLGVVLVAHIERIYAKVSQFNLETISLRERLCVK